MMKTADKALSGISTEDYPMAPQSFLKTQGRIIYSPKWHTPSKEMFSYKAEPQTDGAYTSLAIQKEKGTY